MDREALIGKNCIKMSKKWHDLGQWYRENNMARKAIESFRKSSHSTLTPNRYSANSLATLGFIFWKGEGISKSDTLAILYFKRASEQGHFGATTKLGVLFLEREDLESTRKAVRWLTKGSDNGSERAPWYLGMLYFYGYVGIEQDYRKAFEWLQLSADRGNTETGNLGHMYFNGYGTESNSEKAIMYFTISANCGDIESMHTLGNIFLKPPYDDIEQDVHRSIYWYTKALNGGSKNTWNLARIYFEGEYVTKDESLALDLFVISANDGCVSSMFQCGLMYFNGYEGIEQNLELAIKWLHQVIRSHEEDEEQDHTARLQHPPQFDEEDIVSQRGMAMCLLGEAYEMITPPDYSMMMKWFEKSAELDCKEGCYNLAFRYLHGSSNFVKKDVKKAIHYYKKASSLGSTGAMTNMGYIYEHIIGDFSKAMEWYSIAANNDNITAALILALKYERGSRFLTRDVQESKNWYTMIESRSSTNDLYHIGKDFMNGIPGSIDVSFEKARLFFKMCVDRKFPRRVKKIVEVIAVLSRREVCEKVVWCLRKMKFCDVVVVVDW